MAIGIILGIVLFIAIIGFCAGAFWCSENDYTTAKGICIALAIVFVLSFIIVPFSFRTISSGELAVVRHLGKITGTREAGTNFDLWITNSYQRYDTKVQNVEITVRAGKTIVHNR